MSRPLLHGALLALAGCSLGISPSSYTSGGTEAAPGPHVLAMGGERDAANKNNTDVTTDVWVTSLANDGTVGAWSYERATSIDGYWQPYFVPGFVVAYGYSPQGDDPFVLFAPFQGKIIGDWQRIEVKNEPSYSSSILTGPALNTIVAAGGVDYSSSPSTYFDSVAQATVNRDALTVTAVTPAPSKLTVPHMSLSLLQYKNFLYSVGGHAQSSLNGLVEVAPLDPVSGAVTGNFVATAPMMHSGKPYDVNGPGLLAANGFLYVIGGSLGSSAPSDVVLVGQINEGDGTIVSWQESTKLPTPLSDSGLAISGGYIYVLGGNGATARSDTVLSIKILDSGLLDAAWRPETSLLAPRSGMGAAAY